MQSFLLSPGRSVGILVERLKSLNFHFGLYRMTLSQPRSQVVVKVPVLCGYLELDLWSEVLLSSCTFGSQVFTPHFLVIPGTPFSAACNCGDFAHLES